MGNKIKIVYIDNDYKDKIWLVPNYGQFLFYMSSCFYFCNKMEKRNGLS